MNCSSVPQRSPFRYAGGKSWLIPVVRKWLSENHGILVEPFLGGGSVSLSAVMENLATKAVMSELDSDVASVWKTILSDDCIWLIGRIRGFKFDIDTVTDVLERVPGTEKEKAFRTIVKNRASHGGILASGSGLMKRGESGRGIGSRWYPETLCRRINDIYSFRDRFEFHEMDAFGIIEQYRLNPGVCFFIDPPYTSAGRRLYNLGCVDNDRLFHLVSEIKGHYLMTYDDCDYVRGLADKYGLAVTEVPMRTNHMVQKCELVISDGYPL